MKKKLLYSLIGLSMIAVSAQAQSIRCSSMENLERLNVRSSRLMALPAEISKLKSLKYIEYMPNLHLIVPDELDNFDDKNDQSILDYLKKSGKKFDIDEHLASIIEDPNDATNVYRRKN